MDKEIVKKLWDACNTAKRILQKQVTVDVEDLEAVLHYADGAKQDPPVKQPKPEPHEHVTETNIYPPYRPDLAVGKSKPAKK